MSLKWEVSKDAFGGREYSYWPKGAKMAFGCRIVRGLNSGWYLYFERGG
jgi:hypothetical protein